MSVKYVVRNSETNEFEGQRDTLSAASILAASLQVNQGGTYTIRKRYVRPVKVGAGRLRAMLNSMAREA